MRVTTSDNLTEPAVVIDRPTDSVLVLAVGLVPADVVLYLDKLLSAY